MRGYYYLFRFVAFPEIGHSAVQDTGCIPSVDLISFWDRPV